VIIPVCRPAAIGVPEGGNSSVEGGRCRQRSQVTRGKTGWAPTHALLPTSRPPGSAYKRRERT
jgi:hypothetical protein